MLQVLILSKQILKDSTNLCLNSVTTRIADLSTLTTIIQIFLNTQTRIIKKLIGAIKRKISKTWTSSPPTKKFNIFLHFLKDLIIHKLLLKILKTSNNLAQKVNIPKIFHCMIPIKIKTITRLNLLQVQRGNRK